MTIVSEKPSITWRSLPTWKVAAVNTLLTPIVVPIMLLAGFLTPLPCKVHH